MLLQLLDNHGFDVRLNLIFPGCQNGVHIVAADDAPDTAFADIFENQQRVLRGVNRLHRVRYLVLDKEIHVDKVVVPGDHQRVFLLALIVAWVISEGKALDCGVHLLHVLDKWNLEVQSRLRHVAGDTQGCQHGLLLFLYIVNGTEPKYQHHQGNHNSHPCFLRPVHHFLCFSLHFLHVRIVSLHTFSTFLFSLAVYAPHPLPGPWNRKSENAP